MWWLQVWVLAGWHQRLTERPKRAYIPEFLLSVWKTMVFECIYLVFLFVYLVARRVTTHCHVLPYSNELNGCMTWSSILWELSSGATGSIYISIYHIHRDGILLPYGKGTVVRDDENPCQPTSIVYPCVFNCVCFVAQMSMRWTDFTTVHIKACS